jgi:hypothetical protein
MAMCELNQELRTAAERVKILLGRMSREDDADYLERLRKIGDFAQSVTPREKMNGATLKELDEVMRS